MIGGTVPIFPLSGRIGTFPYTSKRERFWLRSFIIQMDHSRWCLRHLYKPLLQNGFSKQFASSTVFFLSAILHEYLLSVPLKMFKVSSALFYHFISHNLLLQPWAFLGMFGQIPLIFLSRQAERMFGAQLGNLVMWSSLILGHPLAIMMYYHDYVIENFGEGLIQKFGQLQSSSL